MSDDLSKVASARLASGLTIEDARKAVGLTFGPYKSREDDPGLFTMGELRRLTHEMNEDGKRIIREWVIYFFGL